MLLGGSRLSFCYFNHLKRQNISYINQLINQLTKMETITIPKEEYEKLKKKAEVDEELLHELVQGLKDIKAGNVRRVK